MVASWDLFSFSIGTSKEKKSVSELLQIVAPYWKQRAINTFWFSFVYIACSEHKSNPEGKRLQKVKDRGKVVSLGD